MTPRMQSPRTCAFDQFILDAQYEDGGWRDPPPLGIARARRQTVTGWQVAAAAECEVLTDIELPSELWAKIGRYLDSVQYDDGQNYLYVRAITRIAAPPPRPSDFCAA